MRALARKALGAALLLCLAARALGGAAWAGEAPALSVTAPTPELAALVREVAAKTGPRLAAWLGAEPARMEVRVAGSVREFETEAALLQAPQWAAGVAVAERGLILVRSPRLLTSPEQFRPLLVHEMTHLYLSAALPQREHPLWLEEGLAMYASGESSLERGTVMAEAVLQKRLLPFAQIESSLPAEADQVALAYAQSYYFISYLIQEHGPEVLTRLVRSLARGRDLTTALHEATGKGLYALGRDFTAAMESRFSWIALITAGGTVWVVVSVFSAVGLVRRRRAQRARMRAMDDRGPERVSRLGRSWPPPRPRGKVLDSAGLGREGLADDEGETAPEARGPKDY